MNQNRRKNLESPKSNKLNHISLFAGMGGFVAGLERLGVETLLNNDSEANCINTVKNLSPDALNIKASICDRSWFDKCDHFDVVDILSGGFPCQPFSVAGSKDGFEDMERGTRFFDLIKFIRSLNHYPKVLFLENVPNLKIFNDGEWLSEIVRCLRNEGYWVSDKQCITLNSTDITQTPQSRDRLFIIAYHSDYFKKNYFSLNSAKYSGPKMDLWDIVKRDIRQSERVYLSPSNKHYLMIEKSAEEHGKDRLFQVRRGSIRPVKEGVCPTLTANMGAGGHNVPFVIDDYGIRRLTVDECLFLQGFRSNEVKFPKNLPDSAKLKMIGNSVNPDVVEFLGRKLIEDIITHGNRMAISA